MYIEYPPCVSLSHLIETYWAAECMIGDSVSQRILPDGCVDIIFDFGSGDSGESPKLVGTMTSPLEVAYMPGPVRIMGIRFAPGGITAFTRMPVFEITNRSVELPLPETLFDEGFYESMPDITGISERIAYINQYFKNRLHKLNIPDREIIHAVSLIKRAGGQLSVKRLAEETCLCERHFERRFKDAIGISPKLFSNVTRFRFARRYLKTHKEESLFSASLTCGYHDQSHMNKEFRRFGGMNPSEL